MTSVLVTGAAGYVGKKLVRALSRQPERFGVIVATDVRDTPPGAREPGVVYEHHDVRSSDLAALLTRHQIDTVVHLATVVTPGKGMGHELLYDIDVRGSQNVLGACVAAGVSRLVVTSSGAAYGYHADNAPLLTEEAPLRGNPEFAYSDHKRLVEEMLAKGREAHPGLAQLIFRPGTILGQGTENQITAIFTRPVVVGLRESETPFVFVLDDDVVRVIAQGAAEGWSGVYNLAGEGVLTLREVARLLGKPYVAVPEGKLKAALSLLKQAGVIAEGPEQTAFLAHRPVLSADKLRRERGVKLMPSRDVFEHWRRARAS